MAYRKLDLTLVAAHDLKDVNLLTPMQVYAVVSLSGDPRTRQRTPPDRSGGRNPRWNSTVSLSVPVDGDLSRASVHILLRADRALGDRDVGEVVIPLAEIVSGADGSTTAPQFRSYQVRSVGSGKPRGVIDVSFKLGERVNAQQPVYPPNSVKNDEPVLAYPASGPSAAPYRGGYPPQQAPAYGYGYGYPAPGAASGQQGYGYGYGYQQPAVPQGGYGYGYGGQGVMPQRKKNNFGMGLGAGLLGGALGGLLIGDMVSDAAAYDAGYDDGFDAGGFDF